MAADNAHHVKSKCGKKCLQWHQTHRTTKVYLCHTVVLMGHAFVPFSLQYAEMQQSAGRYGEDLKSTKADIADINRKIMRLQSEIDMVKSQVKNITSFMYINVFKSKRSMFSRLAFKPLEEQFGDSDRRGRGARRAGREGR